jgi:phosphatidylserine/phosphatidylglycerophosphate/cardiolipin synthase-like enzyme
MKRFCFGVAVWLACVSASTAEIKVYFSPKGGCTEAVVDALSRARSTVLAQAYSFTSAPIAKALTDAYRRGVKIQVILDKSNQTDKYSAATFTQNYGIPTFIDDRHAIAHNKIMVIDGRTILTGSFNFTKQAEENNAENLLVIDDAALAAKYTANWKAHLAHSKPYRRKEPTGHRH